MKHLISLFRCIFSFWLLSVTYTASYAVEPPSQFVDIRWSATLTDAKRIFSRRAGVSLVEESPTHLVYTGGDFAVIPAERWELEFANNRFWRGTVFLNIPLGTGKDAWLLRSQQFEKLSAMLTAKYGKTHRNAPHDHTDEEWKLTDHAGRKDEFTILLSYAWEPYRFIVQYSYQPDVRRATPSPSSTVKKDI